MKNKTIVLDLETTGLNPVQDEILQIAIINDKGEVLMNQLIKPDYKKEWPEAEKINKINYETVKDKPTFKAIKNQIIKILKEADTIIGYNTDFDLNFLLTSGIPKDHIETKTQIDVMKEFAEIYGELTSKGDFKWQKLTKCAEYYNYQYDNAHDALSDIKATLFCYKKIHNLE